MTIEFNGIEFPSDAAAVRYADRDANEYGVSVAGGSFVVAKAGGSDWRCGALGSPTSSTTGGGSPPCP